MTTISGDDHGCFGVINAGAEALRAEASKHHGVDCSQSSHGEHRHHGLRNQRHIDDDAIALLQAEACQQVGCLLHFLSELSIGERAVVAWLPLEVQGNTIAPTFQNVAIKTVIGDVEVAIGEPSSEGRIRPIQHLTKGGVPVQKLSRLSGPEIQTIC